jgi:hypothetical protein
MQRPIHLGHLCGMFALRISFSTLAPFVERILMDASTSAMSLDRQIGAFVNRTNQSVHYYY